MIRNITSHDWPAIMAIQAQCYADDTLESLTVMQDKWRFSPNSCLVIDVENCIAGYVLAHSWQLHHIPKWDQPLPTAPFFDCLYIHDMAIAQSFRGQGIAQQLYGALTQLLSSTAFEQPEKSPLTHQALVALPSAVHFWQKLGFSQIEHPSATLISSLSSYPEHTQYMLKPLN
ncbi:GNAT family N-acetyltransferase [Shewanella maritima]|uniref:GNAT family N-acetyltransferase n=1 Tax=Shewanella maritima TaxID=2520507 RepID=UPI003734E83A